MGNSKGTAITLVLLILAAVSLIGVGLMTLSRVNTQFTGAIINYDKMFNLADGAGAMAFRDLTIRRRDDQFLGVVPGGMRIDNIFQGTEQSVGDYRASLIMWGYTTQAPPGYEQGAYYPEYWSGEGRGQRVRSQLLVDVSAQKIQATGK
jgi:hypothetical protein